jgi:hypothetical protein
MGPIDLVMDVRELASPADAALWIADRFIVPTIPARKQLNRPERRMRVGYERGLGLLIRSGLWSTLSQATKAIAPVLLDLAEKEQQHREILTVRISYRGITRYSGIQSPNAIRKALLELADLKFLRLPEPARSPLLTDHTAATYTLAPLSDELWELANARALQTQQEITAEIDLRGRKRRARVLQLKNRRENP